MLILYWPKQTNQDLLLLVSLASPTLVLLCQLPSLVLLCLDNISLPNLVVLVYLLPQLVVLLLFHSKLGIVVPLVLCHWYPLLPILGILASKICLIEWLSPTLHPVLQLSKLIFLTCSWIQLGI